MRIDIITIFPGLFKSFLGEALIARALKKKLAFISVHNLREWTRDRRRTIDGRPYGGGAGMVMMAEPIMKAVEKIARGARRSKEKTKIILLSAKGKKFDQRRARKWAKLDRLVLICGRYEGIDERVASYVCDEEISIGDYVLFGGEVPAMVIVEAVTRLVPGTVGKQDSVEDESFKKLSGVEKKMMEEFIEYPHYTRPEKLKIAGKFRVVPKVLLSGNHSRIEKWRQDASRNSARIRKGP